MSQTQKSSQRNIWKRLRKNKGAIFGMIVIIVSIIIAITAYFIAPDYSPDANRMVVEIGGRKPGFKQQFLLLRKERRAQEVSSVTRLFLGKEDDYDYVPINSYKQMDDSLIVEKFIDEGIGERVAFPFSRIQAASQSSEKPWM